MTYTPNATNTSGVHCDFYNDANGFLTIVPTGDYVGIGSGASNPARTLDVFGRARIQTMPTDNTMTEVVVRDATTGDLFVNTDVGALDWHIIGNSNVTAPTNFLGTTNANDVAFRSTNVERMRIIGLTNGVVLAGNIGLGLTNPTARFHSEYAYVQNTTPETNGSFIVNGTYTASGAAITLRAVEGKCTVTGPTGYNSTNIGGDFTALYGGCPNIGVRGTAAGTTNSTSVKVGVYGDALGANRYWAGYFNGFVYSSQLLQVSDPQFKTDIEELQGGLAIVNQLKPKTYLFDTKNAMVLSLPAEKQFGFLTTDIKTSLPELVKMAPSPLIEDTITGALSGMNDSFQIMNYNALIPILVSAVQELSTQVSDLQSELNGCCGTNKMKSDDSENGVISSQTISLKNTNAPFLGQNIPNPYENQTTIPYYLPNEAVHAFIIFSDELGRQFNQIEIIGRGKGQLTALTTELEDGIYSYSPIVDGNKVATKQMVKQH
ncbi:MAG: tail fiber domain-containing protein [Chitinophagales bacterium]|nr:tail fiber domain-containing protein [Chitinophagales bacterium]